jgi:hypothetical protein
MVAIKEFSWEEVSSPDFGARAAWRGAVAAIADKAKAKLPECNGRVESAVKLVLAYDVTPQADGSIEVGSSSDPMKTYRLVGTTCECQDFVHRKAPQGWCQHRIAAGIQKRVGEVLAARGPVEATNNCAIGTIESSAPLPAAPAPALPEAPASVNVRLTIGGREVQWTLRDTDEARLAVRLEELLQRYPLPQSMALASTGAGWCAVHQVAMKLQQKGERTWYSHRTDDGFCKGR